MRAAESNDFSRAERLMDQQLSEVMQGLLLEDYETGRTGNAMTRRMLGAHPEVNIAAVSMQIARKNAEMDGVLEKHGWNELEQFGNSIVQRYKERNGAELVEARPGMTQEEMVNLSLQFEPVMVNPNEIAEFRQRLAQLDKDLRPLGTSVWSDPRTKRIASMLNVDAEPGRPGFLASEEQSLNDQLSGFNKYVGLPLTEGLDTFVGEVAQMGIGARDVLHRLGMVSLDGLSQGNAEAHVQGPTSWVQSSDGTWYHNGGKVGAAEVYAGIWYGITGELIDQQIAQYAHDKASIVEEAGTFTKQGLAIGIGQFMGSMTAFPSAIGAMKAGGLLTKGLGTLVTGGKAGYSLTRTQKMAKILAERSGAAAALGVHEAVKNGRVEGYGVALLHGTAMAVPLMVMGAMGDRVERTLKRYSAMPVPVARTLAGAVEGLGLDFGTWEAGWNFAQDPSDANYSQLMQQVLVNMVGNAALRGTGVTAAERLDGSPRLDAREAIDPEGVARVATERSVSTEAVESLGGAARDLSVTAGRNPSEAAGALDRTRKAEERLNLEASGRSMQEHEKLEARYATREEIKRLMDQPNTPERRKEIIKLLNNSRLAFGKTFATEVKRVVDLEKAKGDAANKEAEDLLAGGDMIRALLGNKDASDIKAQRDAAMEAAKIREMRPKLPHEQMVQEGGKLGLVPDKPPEPSRPGMPKGEYKRPPLPEEEILAARQEPGDIAHTVFGGEDFSKPDPENEKSVKKWMEERRAGGERLSKEEVRRGPESDAWIEWDQRRIERVNNARKAATDESGFVDQEKFQRLVNEWHDAYPQPKRFENFDEGMRGQIDDIAEMAAPPLPKRAGEPASLRMRPALEQEGVPGTKPIRKSDVIRDLQGYEGDAVRVPIRKGTGIRGKLSTKGVLGWYHTRERVIRLKNAEDVVVAVHEASHAADIAHGVTKTFLDDKYNPSGVLTPDEMQGFIAAANPWYPGYETLHPVSQMRESWAEFWARHMLDDPTLREETGAFHDWAMKWISDPARATFRAQMDRQMEKLRRYRDQGAVERGRQSMVWADDAKSVEELRSEGLLKDTTPGRAKLFVKKFWKWFMRAIDDTHRLEVAQREALEMNMSKDAAGERLREMSILDNPVALMQTLRMTPSKQAESMLVHAMHDLAGNPVSESYKAIIDDIGRDDAKNFFNWLMAKRSIEAMEKGLAVGLDARDYLTIIEKTEKPSYEEFAKRMRNFFDGVINYATEAGLFSVKQAADIKGSYKYYMPFQRALMETTERLQPGRGVAERGTGVKKMKGGGEEIRDPINATGDMVRAIVTKSQQAMVMKAMVNFGIVNDGVGSFVTEVKRGIIAKDHPLHQIAKALNQLVEGTGEKIEMTIENATKLLEQLAEVGEIGGAITLFGQQTIPKGSRPIIAYTPHYTEAELARLTPAQQKIAKDKNGKLLWLEVDTDAYSVLMGADQPSTILDKLPSFFRGVLEAPANLLRMGATVLDPWFAVRNVFRDSLSDTIYSSQKNKAWFLSGFGRFIKGISQRGSQGAELFDALGGGISTYYSNEIAAGRTSREMLRINRTVISKAQAGVHNYSDWLGENFEKPLRRNAFIEVYEKSLAEGKTQLEASLLGLQAGKSRSIDFTRGGIVSRSLNRIVPYTSATINANRKFMESVLGKNGDVAQKQAILRGFINITIPTLALWWLNKDEDWYQELPEWRRMNYWQFKLPGVDKPIELPKPFELGKLFGNLPEATLDEMFSDHPLPIEDVLFDIVASMLPPAPMPAVARPIYESYTNKSLFTGREIVPDWLERSRLPQDQRTAYTREFGELGAMLMRGIGFDPSPMKVEHFINSMMGGMPGRLEDTVKSGFGIRTLLSGEGIGDVPGLGVFFGRSDYEQSRSVQHIFDLDKRFTQEAGSGVLDSKGQQHRREVGRAKDRIAELKKLARDGKIQREEADRLAAKAAQEALRRIGQ